MRRHHSSDLHNFERGVPSVPTRGLYQGPSVGFITGLELNAATRAASLCTRLHHTSNYFMGARSKSCCVLLLLLLLLLPSSSSSSSSSSCLLAARSSEGSGLRMCAQSFGRSWVFWRRLLNFHKKRISKHSCCIGKLLSPRFLARAAD